MNQAREIHYEEEKKKNNCPNKSVHEKFIHELNRERNSIVISEKEVKRKKNK